MFAIKSIEIYPECRYRKNLEVGIYPMGVEDPESFFFGFHMKREHVHLQPLNMLVQDVVESLRS